MMFQNKSLVKLTDIDFELLVPKTKVRSLLSYAEGIIITQDKLRKELEIEWARDEETTITRIAHRKLSSVVLASTLVA